ncbi:MAG: hypothetical protein ACI97K_001232 [Glaciecola sp.]|jgi:hypothetical protein
MQLIGKVIFVLALFGIASCAENDGLPQQANPDFIPKNKFDSFSEKRRPIVWIDEAHSNYHTAKGRYKPFVQVLISSGFIVKTNDEKFTSEHLQDTDILVIANALHENNRWDWTPPHFRAFEPEEVVELKKWVLEGGSLLLIADHIPFPKASEGIAAAFGFKLANGHVEAATFTIDDATLAKHPAITKDVFSLNGVIQVKSFGGSAFQIPESAISLLTFKSDEISLMPKKPFVVRATTERISINGWSQGAILEAGKGRVAVFGEASMFTSQIDISTGKVGGYGGLIAHGAEQNEQFLLNVMHWLSHKY